MIPSVDTRARHDAERVRHKAFWHQVLHNVRGLPNELMHFDSIKHLYPQSESYGGVRPIPIRQIVGSVDRYRDFDHYFLPRFNLPLDRWINIRRARLKGIELPAIQVYKVGEIYFVKDGHHRVSVAREEGQKYIDAEIIELNVPIKPEAGDSLKDIIIKGEYGKFLDATQLKHLRPAADIRFTVTGRYDVLLEHIHTHQYFLGLEQEREISWQEAVISWYDIIYLPVVAEIRAHAILDRFPGRTEADLYLWIMDHRYYLKEQLGKDVGSELATKDYAEHYAPNGFRRLRKALNRLVRLKLR
jgi:hypothetical protein